MSHYTYAEEEILGRGTKEGRMRYKDPEAFYCKTCEFVFGVTCPNCGIVETKLHVRHDPPLFTVDRPLALDVYDGFRWVKTTCLKCDFCFKVMVM